MANRLYNKQVTPKGYQKGGSVKKEKGVIEFRTGKKFKKVGPVQKVDLLGKGRAKKMGGGMMMQRPMMKKGGPLKPVDPKTQKGLSKLPTEVRNKMGYMKDGGKVKKKKPLSRFKKPKPGSYDYTLLNRPKHSPAPIKPKPKE